MSDAIALGILALISTIFTGVMAYLTVKLNQIGKTGQAVHTLVNSNMGTQLTLNAVVSRRLADLTKTPEDEEAADKANKILKEYETKQELVDNGKI